LVEELLFPSECALPGAPNKKGRAISDPAFHFLGIEYRITS